MDSLTILVTGATDGIGLATASELARRGHRVVLHGRDQSRLDEALETVRRLGRRTDHATVRADFSSLTQVSEMSAQFVAEMDRLDVLVNNAGVYMKESVLSEDGFEMTFAVNHLAHFLLTLDLMGVLRNGTAARIVNVSSVAHARGRLDVKSLQSPEPYSGYEAYAQSKLANMLFTRSLSERLADSPTTVNALHPGAISTKLLHAGFRISGASPEEGAETPVYLATSPDVDGVSGRYFVNCSEREPEERAHDDAAADLLWDTSVRMVQSAVPDWQPSL